MSWKAEVALKDSGERLIPDHIHAADSLTRSLFKLHMDRYQLVAELGRNKRILDIACGSGYGSRYLLEQGAREVTGADICPEAIEYAQQRYGAQGLRFVVGDATSYSDGTFDVVASFETIEHLVDPLAFLQHVLPMLAPGGYLVVSASTVPTSDIYAFHLHDFDEPGLRALVVKAGFHIVSELAQAESFTPKETRAAIRYHPATIPLRRIALRPAHYLTRCWQLLVSKGIEYKNLSLVCQV